MKKKQSKSKSEHNYQLTYLKWIDSISPNDTWHDLHDLTEWDKTTNSIAIEVGFLIQENVENVFLARSFMASGGGDDPELFCGVVRVPKKSIVEIKQIKL